jgi:DNA repair protein RadC
MRSTAQSTNPLADRPFRTLTDAELLTRLLHPGRPNPSTLELVQALLADCGGLAALPAASPSLLGHLGLRPGQAAALVAVCEIHCRLTRLQVSHRQPLRRPEPLVRYLTLRYQASDQEIMGALFLDSRYRLLGDKEIFRGTLHRATVEPRPILKECLLRSAAGVVVFHTHPSGDPTPSGEDRSFTRRMAAAAELVGVELLDHLVLGSPGTWTSLLLDSGW